MTGGDADLSELMMEWNTPLGVVEAVICHKMASWAEMLEKTAVGVRNGNVDLAAHVIRKEGERSNMLFGQLSKFHLEALLKNGQKVNRKTKSSGRL